MISAKEVDLTRKIAGTIREEGFPEYELKVTLDEREIRRAAWGLFEWRRRLGLALIALAGDIMRLSINVQGGVIK